MSVSSRVQSGVFQGESCASYRDIVKEVVTNLLQQCLYAAKSRARSGEDIALQYRRGVEAWLSAPTVTLDSYSDELRRMYPLLPTLYKNAFLSIAVAVFESDRPVHINEGAVDLRQGIRTLIRTMATTDEVLTGEYIRMMNSIERTQFIESLIRRCILHDHAAGGIVYATEAEHTTPYYQPTTQFHPAPLLTAPMHAAASNPPPPVLQEQVFAPPPRDNTSVDPSWGSGAKLFKGSGASNTELPTQTSMTSLNILSKVSPNSPQGTQFPREAAENNTELEHRFDKDLDLPLSGVSFTAEVRRKIAGEDVTGGVSLVSVDDSASQVAAAMKAQK